MKEILLSMCTLSLLSSVSGQVKCVGELREATDLCRTIGNTCTISAIVSQAEDYVLHPPHEVCLNKPGYFLALADFCAVSVDIPEGSPNEALQALDKAIQFVAKSGEMKPELMQMGGEGALRMIQLYEYQSQIYLTQNDTTRFKSAMEKRELWSHLFNGVNSGKPECIHDHSSVNRKDPMPVQTHIVHHPKWVDHVSKPVIVLGHSQEEQALLMDGRLNIKAEPDLELIPSNHPKRFSYSLSFEAGLNYWVTLSHPDFEEQFIEFSTDQIPQRDTLFVQMYVLGTPCFYTRFGKRSFVPDSFSILVIRNRYGSMNDFNKLIKELDLQVDSVNQMLYHKRSGNVFDSIEDSVLTKLRERPDLIEAAGANLGTSDRINILTNQVRIIWNQKPSETSSEEASNIETFLKENQLKEIADGLFEASPSIGLGLNNLVEKLNELKGIHLAYPESFEPIYPN